MSLGIPKSNFNFIEINFSDIILEIRNGANGLPSDARTIRKTIVFQDLSKMYCTEILENTRREIELYWYDWYEHNQQLIMKFHAHYHPDGTPKEITIHDPFHIQTNSYRGPNNQFRELNQILEFVRVRQLSLKK
ncbi:toxin-antitoxin system TumE family protein [Paenibacillus sp. 481]|uniref:toxin-antitoxin system TumE family protein n=1 Tax=Paenibacillus sp. 481 TaxID=2835869 RepID=UPI001E3AFE52|nr:DUF6516 family protein [Paenibacillus sp. 481]UHA75469.1 hypothetical protein KIK04_10980 [Paenibacillus sp. 481]